MKDEQREAEERRMYEEMGLMKVLSLVSSNALFPESGSLFTPDLIEKDAIDNYLMELSQEVAFRSLDEHFVARTVGVKIRYPDFTTTSIQTTPQDGIYNSSDVFEYASRLFWQRYKGGGIRLLGVGLYQMYSGDDIEQEELFKEQARKKRELERVILDINKKGTKLTRASSLIKDKGRFSG